MCFYERQTVYQSQGICTAWSEARGRPRRLGRERRARKAAKKAGIRANMRQLSAKPAAAETIVT